MRLAPIALALLLAGCVAVPPATGTASDPLSACSCPPCPTVPPPPPATLRIMPLGDSITLGVNGGYRCPLQAALTKAGRAFDFVGSQWDQWSACGDHDHEGRPGFSSHDVIAAGAWRTGNPTHVLLMAGTNDAAWWSVESGAQIADRVAGLVVQILADVPGVVVVVSSIPPMASAPLPPNGRERSALGREYNAALRARVEAMAAAGKRARWVDAGGAVTVGELYDGVHPTEASATNMAPLWLAALGP